MYVLCSGFHFQRLNKCGLLYSMHCMSSKSNTDSSMHHNIRYCMYFNINIPYTNYDTDNITDNLPHNNNYTNILKDNNTYKKSTVIKYNTNSDTF